MADGFLYAQGILYYFVHKEELHSMTAALRWALRPESGNRGFYLLVVKTVAGVIHYLEKLITAHRPLVHMMDFMKESVKIPDRKSLDLALSTGKDVYWSQVILERSSSSRSPVPSMVIRQL